MKALCSLALLLLASALHAQYLVQASTAVRHAPASDEQPGTVPAALDLDAVAVGHWTDLDSDEVTALVIDAGVLMATGSPEAARARLFDALLSGANPALTARCLRDLAHLALLRGDLREAEHCWDRLVALEPANAQARCQRGIARAALFCDQEAVMDLLTALDQDPELPEAHAHLAIVLLRSARRTDACQALQRAHDLGDRTVEELLLVHCGH